MLVKAFSKSVLLKPRPFECYKTFKKGGEIVEDTCITFNLYHRRSEGNFVEKSSYQLNRVITLKNGQNNGRITSGFYTTITLHRTELRL
uniref:Uncharacterized protein n=1 Tax=Lepeophtheirus salmonis TaxID=72036 RepID=A0A0K2UJ92_LEPSM